MGGTGSEGAPQQSGGSFEAEHRRLYGYDIPDEIVEFVHFKTSAIGVTEKPTLAKLPPGDGAAAVGERDVYFREGGWQPTAIYDRSSLSPGASLAGPAVVEEEMSTTLLHPGQTLVVDDYGNLLLQARKA